MITRSTNRNLSSRTPRRLRTSVAIALGTVAALTGACTAAPTAGPGSNNLTSGPRPSPESSQLVAQASYVTPERRLGIGGCPIFPEDNVFHAQITSLPRRSDSAAVIAAMGGLGLTVRPGFSSMVWQGSRGGIPVNIVDSRESAKVDFVGGKYAYLSDLDRHPMPAAPKLEGWPGLAWDRHLLIVDTATCVSSEFFFVTPPWLEPNGRWAADTAIKIDLRSNGFSPVGAATASGTSMLAGMIRYDEVASGKVNHVIGITMPKIKAGPPIWPAIHSDGRSDDPNAPAMGTWLRLRRDLDVSRFGPQARAIIRALQDHGAVIVDTNGGGMALNGEPDDRWDDADLSKLGSLSAADFDVIDPSPMKIADDSHRIR